MISIFKYLYSLLIVCIFLIGQIPLLGGINLLQITIVLTLLICLLLERKLIFDNWLRWYSVFVFFFFLSSVYTGYESGFRRFLSSQMICSYTIYYATYVLLRRNISVNYLVLPLILIGCLDSLMTICQAYGIPIHNPLLNYLEIDSEQEELLASNANLLGLSISGLYANPVFNGHYLLVFCLSSLFCIFSVDKKSQFLGLASSTFILIGLFFCQQRGAFFISVIAWFYIIYKYVSAKINNKVLTFILLALAGVYIVSSLIGFLEFSDSRLISDSDSGREMLLRKSIEYYLLHPFIGGYYECMHLIGRPSHNFFVSAFLAGGLLGGITLVSMVLRLIVMTIRQIGKYDVISPISIFLLGLVSDSMVHNTGLVEGDSATFLALSLFIYTLKYTRKSV